MKTFTSILTLAPAVVAVLGSTGVVATEVPVPETETVPETVGETAPETETETAPDAEAEAETEAPVEAEVTSSAFELTSENLEASMNNTATPYWLVKMYAPDDERAKGFLPMYNDIVARFADREDVGIARFDVTKEEHKAIAEKWEIKEGQHPDLKWFNTKHNTEEFYRPNGPQPRSAEEALEQFVQFVEGRATEALQTVADEAELTEKLAARKYSETAFVFRGNSTEVEIAALADKMRPANVFLVANGTESLSLTLHRGISETETYAAEGKEGEAAWSAEAILKWSETARAAKFGNLTAENFEDYLSKATSGMLWACLTPSEDKEAMKAEARKYEAAFLGASAKLNDTAIPFVWFDTHMHGEQAKEELRCTEFPSIAYQRGNLTESKNGEELTDDVQTFTRSFAANAEELTEDAITAFFEDVKAGKVQAYDSLDALDDSDVEEEGEGEGEDIDDMDSEEEEDATDAETEQKEETEEKEQEL